MAAPFPSTSTLNNPIKVLDSASAHKIFSGQVVVDLQTAVAELVENSLDAGSTSIGAFLFLVSSSLPLPPASPYAYSPRSKAANVSRAEVRFKDYGLESFDVVDNGSGIPPKDYDYIAFLERVWEGEATSKLTSFSDLDTVTTFGFRGDALSSLCALSDVVSVTTVTAADAPAGTVMDFDRTGKAKQKKPKAARQFPRGSTVSVSGLFKPLPVRCKELECNARREHAKALALLHAYAQLSLATSPPSSSPFSMYMLR
ncbi:hypothetical protein GSI_03546 [Ganoderma sinense ZZ0214-1]|uniref:DNA mismatch repair protein S5 domain-containing protein n=1 Tax=Ganoderma sinense ZZ0214-1 TaxID=1077348 RepID=A0A2G8SJC2_9APHY|nr:hypothetical protein GSI_03546 [Ganoderma sinense ZZ0214-1]